MEADREELENLDSPEIHTRRLNAKEVVTPKSGEYFIFPIADGQVKLFGGYQVLRTSTLRQEQPEGGEVQGDLRGESDGSQPLDSFADDSEASNDFLVDLTEVHLPSSR